MVQAISPTRPGFRTLLFHDVPATKFTAFEDLVAYVVQEHGVLTPSQAANWINGNRDARIDGAGWKRPCLFSFDDGFRSNFDLASTILERYGVKALFFVAPGLTDLSGSAQRDAIARNIFDGRIGPDCLDPALRLMTWDEIARLKLQGHEIGCHGMSHQRLTKLEGAALDEEIISAGEILDEKLNQKTAWYAYAFGDIESIDETALGTIMQRYRFCRSGVRGSNAADNPSGIVYADSMAPDAISNYQKLLLEGGLDIRYLLARRKMRKLRVQGR